MTFESAKLLAASTRAVEWYKSCAHISFLSEVIQINSYVSQLNTVEWYKSCAYISFLSEVIQILM